MPNSENIVITAELKDLISGHLKEITSEVNRLDGSISNLGNKSIGGGGGGFTGSIISANLLTSAIQQAGSAIIGFGVDAKDAYSRTEGYEARLTTLLGDRKNAEMAIANLRKDAAKTPFDLDSLIQGNSLLIGSGASAKEARKSIMDLGNAIAATGGGSDELSRMAVNLGQIKSIGKASALDIKQFMYANIPIYELLSRSMKKPISQIKEMDISYKDLTKALAEAREENGKFYHGLENASNTTKGLESNLDDLIETMKSGIGETFIDYFKDGLRSLMPMMEDFNKDLISVNESAKILSRAGVGYKWTEGPQERGELAGLKQRLDAVVAFSANGDKEADKGIESLTKEIKKITDTYQFQRAEELAGNKEFEPDATRYMREMALINDTIDTIKKQKKLSGSNPNNSGGAGASDLEKVAKGNRPTQVNINIENLVRELNNTYQNVEKGMELTVEQLSKYLLGVVNDVSVLSQPN